MAEKYECIIISKNEDLKDFCFELQEKEKYQLVLVLLGELVGKIQVKTRLAAYSSSEIYIATLLSGESDLNIDYVSNHIGEESNSSFKLYGLLSDNARKKSVTRIVFNRGANNATGEESEEVTLMSNRNENISSPIIESYEESSHGTHSSCTGHFDKERIDYLRSRGIDKERARLLLRDSGLLNFLKPIGDQDIVEYILRKVKNETR